MRFIVTVVLLMFAFVSFAIASDDVVADLATAADVNGDDMPQLIDTVDQFTPNQDDDSRREVNVAIYQYYDDPESQGNVPKIVNDTREYSGTRNQSPVNLKPASPSSP